MPPPRRPRLPTLRRVSSPVANPLALATLYGHADLELVLVRHCQQIPPEQRTQAQRTDPPLSTIGERQIEAVADHLAHEDVTAVYSSHLERAHRTGLAIAARHDLDVSVDEGLREIDLLQAIPQFVRDVLVCRLAARQSKPGICSGEREFLSFAEIGRKR